MLAKVACGAVLGVDAYHVEVEVDIALGVPAMAVVGLGDLAVQEAKQRVRSAIRNSGYDFAPRRITVNLAPADVRKEGPLFDLAIAIGILAASDQLDSRNLLHYLLVGELSLDGHVLYVSEDGYGTGDKLWRSYPVGVDGTVGPGKVFFDPPTSDRTDPDGMTIDSEGTLYLTGRGGIWAVCPDGRALGFVPTAEFCANVTFGGADGKTLFVTCNKTVYKLSMTVRGSRPTY